MERANAKVANVTPHIAIITLLKILQETPSECCVTGIICKAII